MATPQSAILTELQKYQWYTHMRRTEDADLGVIRKALSEARAEAEAQGVNLCILFGPTLADDLGVETGADFQPYPGYTSPDGSKTAVATQEELLLWLHHADKDLCWDIQHTFRRAVAGHMTVARETPAFIYKNSLDLTGHIDGIGNPEPEDQHDRAIIDDGEVGAGGSFCIAQRWVHDLDYWSTLTLEQEGEHFRAQPRPTPPGWKCRCPHRTCRMWNCVKAPQPTRPHLSAAKWCGAPLRTPSTTGLSGSTSWASARRRPRSASAWTPCTARMAKCPMPSPTTPPRPRARTISLPRWKRSTLP